MLNLSLLLNNLKLKFKILIKSLRILLANSKNLEIHEFHIIKDESFTNSLISIKFNIDNFIYVEFPGVGKKLYNGELVINASNISFPYSIRVQGLNEHKIFIVEFSPQNELILNSILIQGKNDVILKKNDISIFKIIDNLTFKNNIRIDNIRDRNENKVFRNSKRVIREKSKIKLELNTFDKNLYL